MDSIKWLIEFIWDRFELFIRRVLFPSSVFIIFISVIDYYSNSSIIIHNILNFINSNTLSVVMFVAISVILSINYILKFIVQFIFDNFIKIDYNPLFCFRNSKFKILDRLSIECNHYKKLKEKVISKLKEKNIIDSDFDINDFLLYQILGNILREDTKRYVTDAKEGGVVIVSMMVSLVWYSYLQHSLTWGILSFVGVVLLYAVGYFYIKSKYRSRAYRLYINYLIDHSKA